LKTRSRSENEKPGNEKLNSRFTLKSPVSARSSFYENKVLLPKPFQAK
jgi:hypothetical protein